MIDLSAGGYATVDDLIDGGWIDVDPPSSVERYLRSATFVVARAAARNPYGDVPTGADTITLRDATCAQASSWIALGIDPQMLGIDGPPLVKRSEILSGKVEYDTAAHAKAREEAVSELAPEAETILAAGGLLWAPVPLANVGCLPSWGLDPVSPGAYAWPELDGASWPFQ